MIKEKDRVRLTYWRLRRGVVVRAGLEVSEVKFDKGHTGFHLNKHLEQINDGLRTERTSRDASKASGSKSDNKGKQATPRPILKIREGTVQRTAKGRKAHHDSEAGARLLQR